MKLEGAAPCVSPPSLFKVCSWPIRNQQTCALPVYPFNVPKNSHIIGAVPHEQFGHCQILARVFSPSICGFQPHPPKTQRQKKNLCWSQLRRPDSESCHQCIPTNSDQWVRCYCVIVNGVALWCVMWPCGVNQWRPSQLAAAAASQQSRRSLNQDHVCDLEVWRHSATTPCHQNSSYTPATQLKHQFSNAFCWKAWRLLSPTSDHLYLSSPYLHTCILLGASSFSRMFLTLVHSLHQSSQFQPQQFHQQQSHAANSKETEIIWDHKWLISSQPCQPSYPLSQLNPSGPLVYHQSSHQSCGSSVDPLKNPQCNKSGVHSGGK